MVGTCHDLVDYPSYPHQIIQNFYHCSLANIIYHEKYHFWRELKNGLTIGGREKPIFQLKPSTLNATLVSTLYRAI